MENHYVVSITRLPREFDVHNLTAGSSDMQSCYLVQDCSLRFLDTTSCGLQQLDREDNSRVNHQGKCFMTLPAKTCAIRCIYQSVIITEYSMPLPCIMHIEFISYSKVIGGSSVNLAQERHHVTGIMLIGWRKESRCLLLLFQIIV